MCTLERELCSARSTISTSVLCPGAVNTPIGAGRGVCSRRAARGEASESSTEGAKLNSKLNSALSHGMDPDEAGRLVRDAVLNAHFWVLTDPKLTEQQRNQVEAMLGDRSLSRLRLF